jgi:predicted metalloendopeptidase
MVTVREFAKRTRENSSPFGYQKKMSIKHWKLMHLNFFEKPFYQTKINMSKISYLDHVATLLPPQEVEDFSIMLSTKITQNHQSYYIKNSC